MKREVTKGLLIALSLETLLWLPLAFARFGMCGPINLAGGIFFWLHFPSAWLVQRLGLLNGPGMLLIPIFEFLTFFGIAWYVLEGLKIFRQPKL